MVHAARILLFAHDSLAGHASPQSHQLEVLINAHLVLHIISDSVHNGAASRPRLCQSGTCTRMHLLALQRHLIAVLVQALHQNTLRRFLHVNHILIFEIVAAVLIQLLIEILTQLVVELELHLASQLFQYFGFVLLSAQLFN